MHERAPVAPARPLALRARAALVWLLAAAGVFAFQLPFFDRWFSLSTRGTCSSTPI